MVWIVSFVFFIVEDLIVGMFLVVVKFDRGIIMILVEIFFICGFIVLYMFLILELIWFFLLFVLGDLMKIFLELFDCI